MKNAKSDEIVLGGDIGGTKTNLGLFVMKDGRPAAKKIESYSSKDAESLEEIVRRFFKAHPERVASACFGIAGPVEKGTVHTTNLPWTVTASGMKDQFNIGRVTLLNDLAAKALSIPLLRDDEILPMNSADAIVGETIGLVAPGTGLGQALLVSHKGMYLPVASEGGHVDFAPRNAAEVRLWEYLAQRYGHVSVERILSGAGLHSLYSWLRDSDPDRESDRLRKLMIESDAPRVITQQALEVGEPLCLEALDFFISVFGAVAGNLALTGLTRGGMFLGGGIPPRIAPRLESTTTFMDAFSDKGRFRDLMESIPVKIIMNDKAALIGAAWCAFQDEM
jgi:glucokinase